MDKTSGYIYRNDGDMRAHEFFLYSLVRGIKPNRILEIGMRTGISTMAMVQALSDGGITCDYHVCDIDNECGQVIAGLPIPISFHHMPSDELAKVWVDGTIDIFMIDGCHEYSQVRKDFFHFLPYVSVGGFILFHDTNPSEQDKHPGACWDAYRILGDIRDIAAIGALEYVTLPYSYGLTVVRILSREI